MTVRIGVDLGGTKIEVVALDDRGTELLRRRVPSPSHSYEEIVETIGALVVSAERELNVRANVGIGTPGAPSLATGLMKNANSTVLNGRPLLRDLQSRLGRAIRMANDANCFALSEATDGAACDAGVMFGVILGTGVGGGVVVHGHSIVGANAIAGEWGHNPLPWPRSDERPGPACYCGKQGCIETFLSGPALARDGGGGRDARTLIAAAREGDASAAAAFERYVDRLARSLATVVNVVDPHTVVLGGGLSNVEELYRVLPGRLAAYVFSDRIETRVVCAAHGDSSGVRGAAQLWPSAPGERGGALSSKRG